LAVHPNPFNPTTTITFELGETTHTRVAIYDLRGALVIRLCDGMLPAGLQKLPWNGRDHRGRSVASGVYVVEIEGGGERQTAKVALLK
jgi:flagellar hook assembly protein FlgD